MRRQGMILLPMTMPEAPRDSGVPHIVTIGPFDKKLYRQ